MYLSIIQSGQNDCKGIALKVFWSIIIYVQLIIKGRTIYATTLITVIGTSYVEKSANLMALMIVSELDTLASVYYQAHLEFHYNKLVRESNFLEVQLTD